MPPVGSIGYGHPDFDFALAPFPIVFGVQVDEMTHLDKSGVEPTGSEVFEVVDTVVAGDDGQPIVRISRVDQVVEHLDFPVGVALHAKIVEYQVGNLGQRVDHR